MTGRRLPRVVGFAATLAFAVLLPAALRAQARTADPAAWAGRTILEIAVTIDGTPTTDPRWVSLVETLPGAQLSLDVRREALL